LDFAGKADPEQKVWQVLLEVYSSVAGNIPLRKEVGCIKVPRDGQEKRLLGRMKIIGF
jgi:hypothetical protein